MVPCTVTPDCWNDSEPPTSTLLATTLGMTRVIDHTSMRFGSVCSTSWLSTVCFSADVVSSSGASPDTTTPSSSWPIESDKSARAVWSEFTAMFRCSAGRKPCIVAFTM